MRKTNIKLSEKALRILSVFLSFALLTGAANTSVAGFGNISVEEEREIFQGVYYREISGFNASGNEHVYMLEVKGAESPIVPFVYSGDVRGKSTVGNMIAVMGQYGYKTVGAVNGDVYDTSSGTPKGLSVHEGNIITSGYAPDRVICYDWDGRASLADVNLRYSLKAWRFPLPEEAEPPQENYYFEAEINAFNVQHGGALGLHAFNRNYAPSTMTTGRCVEVLIECEDAQLRINRPVYGKVLSVSSDTKDSPIGANQIVLSAAEGAASFSLLSSMIVGSDVEIGVSDVANSQISGAKEVIGVFSTIVENGRVVASDRAVHPRTAIGIKEDGSAIYYVVDGRQSGHSAGLDLVAVAEHLIQLGCVQAVNMDGGGSATLFARFPGLEGDAALRNKPSDGSQRKVSNGILLVYTGSAASAPVKVHLYPKSNLLMPGADTKIDLAYTDAYYEKLARAESGASLQVTAGDGYIAGDVFYAGALPGIVEIGAYTANGSGSCLIEVVDDIEMHASESRVVAEPSASVQINIAATYGSKRVTARNELFDWSCDDNIGSIDASGNFKASARNLQTGNIYVAYKDRRIVIPAEVKSPPPVFTDIQEHWAKEYIDALAAQGIVKGMDETTFDPDGPLTRAQFLSLLWRLDGETPPRADTRAFADVDESMWFFGCVYWGFENGIVTGVEAGLFAPDAAISREQMASMLYRYAGFKNKRIADASEAARFVDDANIGEWARASVYAMYASGILNGYPENTFEPAGTATRAQAAKVIHVFGSLPENAQGEGDPQTEGQESLPQPESPQTGGQDSLPQEEQAYPQTEEPEYPPQEEPEYPH
jgi:exopolysaccharide biosynthesis protein